MTANELLDEYIDGDFSIMKDGAMGPMIEIPYHTVIHIMQHYRAIKEHEHERRQENKADDR
jgi:hypothetical protein